MAAHKAALVTVGLVLPTLILLLCVAVFQDTFLFLPRSSVDRAPRSITPTAQPATSPEAERAAWYQTWKRSMPRHYVEPDRGEIAPYVDFVTPLVYCAIPKNACTQYKGLLFRIKGDMRYLSAAHVHSLGSERGKPMNITRVTELDDKEGAEFLRGAGVERFAIVRNPVVRVLSGFMDKSGLFPCSREEFRAWVRRTFVDDMENKCGVQVNQHWKSQLCFCGFRVAAPGEVFRIFHYENVDEVVRYLDGVIEDKKVLSTGWGRQRDVSFLESFSSSQRVKGHTTQAATKVAEWFDLETFDYLVNVLRPEIDSLGYQGEIAEIRQHLASEQTP